MSINKKLISQLKLMFNSSIQTCNFLLSKVRNLKDDSKNMRQHLKNSNFYDGSGIILLNNVLTYIEFHDEIMMKIKKEISVQEKYLDKHKKSIEAILKEE